MPTYQYQCESCGVGWEEWRSIRADHPKMHDSAGLGCGPVVQVISAPVVRSAEGHRVIDGDAILAKDRDAYKRLRADGLQPKGIDGARHFENHASTQFEVETGYIAPNAAARKQLADARKRADDYTQATS